jgi:hypothetical protein
MSYVLFMKPLWTAMAGLALLVGCGGEMEKSDPQHETREVEAGGAESARIEVDMGAGELDIAPGAAKLTEAHFRYDPPSMKPELSYSVGAGRGYLTVRQPSMIRQGLRNVRESRWELKLNEKIPAELKVKLGAGKAMLRLGGVPLTRLTVDFGAGEMELDLKGAWTKDLDASVEGGVGEARVLLPKDVGVRVKAQGGIGEIKAEGLRREGPYFVNDQYGKSPIDIRLEITGGVGTIRLIG